MRIQVLGTVRVQVGDELIEIARPGSRAMLGLLALAVGQPLSRAELIEALWGDQPPSTAVNMLQTHIKHLRRLLEPRRDRFARSRLLPAVGDGYALHLPADHVDLYHFRDLVDAAAVAERDGDPHKAADLLGRGLRLWQGPPLADLPSLTGHPKVVALPGERRTATARYGELLIAVGDAAAAVAVLEAAIAEQPLDEAIGAALIRAYQAAGRRDRAFTIYHQTRHRLAEQLGVDPGPELNAAHTALLHQQNDTAVVHNGQTPAVELPTGVLDRDTHDPAPATASPLAPRQLPAPPQMFTGRAHELATIDQFPDASTVVIAAIDGMAGIGKTALVIHAAHRIANQYPDGQLFIDLHGYTEGVDPIEPGEALDHLLRALGVPWAQIPASLDQRAALYRTQLAGKRMLIVLDNAAMEAQVVPLLPGSPGCLVLITSRRRLTGLDHTHTLSLDTLPIPDAVELFTRNVGTGRQTGQPAQRLAELVELCGRLPLAIRIAAARLRSHPTWRLSHLLQRLRDQHHRLGELETGHRGVTAALDLSYQHLNRDQQRAYRRLGLHPGPEIEPYAAAALLDSTTQDAGRMLDQLHNAHLLQEPTPGRYRFHDLSRAHAAHTAASHETEPRRRAALDRLLDYYRYTASAATNAAYQYERERQPQVPPARTPVPELPAPAIALAWLDIELPNLLTTARHAMDQDRPEYILHLSCILRRHLATRGRYHDAGILHHQALMTARATGHQTGELNALADLANIHWRQGRYQQAANHLERALQLARAIGHRLAELRALIGLGHTHRRQGRYQQAINHHRRALQLARAIGHRPAELDALVGLGCIHLLKGRHQQAADRYERALRIARATNDRPGELNALTGLGNTHRMQSRYEQANDCFQRLHDLGRQTDERNFEYEARQGMGRLSNATGDPYTAVGHHHRALALARELGHPFDEARAHDGLAHAYHALDQLEQARDHWQHALDILTGLGIDHTDDQETTVAAIHTHLTSLPVTPLPVTSLPVIEASPKSL